jgi:hypothetical protein
MSEEDKVSLLSVDLKSAAVGSKVTLTEPLVVTFDAMFAITATFVTHTGKVKVSVKLNAMLAASAVASLAELKLEPTLSLAYLTSLTLLNVAVAPE